MSTLRMMAIDEICQRGSIRDVDVEMLRRNFAHDPHLSAGDVDALIRIHALARVQDPAWADFFIETMTDYVVRELEPTGYVTAGHAGWLIARVSTCGRVRSRIEHDLLLNVIDKSRWVPESLQAFAIAQIRDAVACGDGPLRVDGSLPAGVITAREVDQLRALLFAYGADGPSAITQVEAELLMDIDAALPPTPGFEGDENLGTALEAWSDLAILAIANAVLDASGYACPSREEALINSQSRGLVSIGGQTGDRPDAPASSARGGVGALSCYGRQTSEARAIARLESQRIEIITGEPVGDADAERLAIRLLADGEAGPRASQVQQLLQRFGFELHRAFNKPSTGAASAA